MHGAPYTNPQMPPPVTGRSFTKIGLTLFFFGLIVLGSLFFVLKRQGKAVATPRGETPVQAHKSRSVYPPLEEQVVAKAEPRAEDQDAQRWAEQQRINHALLAALEDLKKRKAAPGGQPRASAPKLPSKPPLYIANKLDIPTTSLVSPVPEYTLAPGATRLPCIIEPMMNSDVEGYFTAKVTTNVYDTATGRHLLVPQGSTILGHDQSSKLIYGNERMDTVSLKLTLPDGRTVDLGRAPVTDQRGMNGLTGRVDQHYGRLLAAVLIQGVLRGGTTAMTTAMTDATGAGQVASGVAGVGSQTATKITGPMLNTRPTIEVDAGQLCQVLLLEPLMLPSMWQNGEPREAHQNRTPIATRR